MTCDECQKLLNAYADGELELSKSLDVERHVNECETCRRMRSGLAAASAAIGGASLYYTAPAGLEERIRARLPVADERTLRLPGRRWMAVAAMVAICATVAWGAMGWLKARPENLVAQEVVSDHVRSLMAEHVYDVKSTDQHTVKPWFEGRIDFAPDVRDFKDHGFALQGGRLDYLSNRAVAALVYQHEKHVINLFESPATGPDEALTVQRRQGYVVAHCVKAGMNYWLVSDMGEETVKKFAGLLATQ